MKALSIWQPYASLISTGAKLIETRSRLTHFRGEILICAAVRKNKGELLFELAHWGTVGGLAPLVGDPLCLDDSKWSNINIDDLPFGKAVAVADLYDSVPVEDLKYGQVKNQLRFGDFNDGRHGWLLKNIRRLKNPFPVKGQQGMFNVDVTNKNMTFYKD